MIPAIRCGQGAWAAPRRAPQPLGAVAASEVLGRVHGGEIGELKLVEIENTGWDLLNAGIHWLDYFVMLTDNAPLGWVLAALDTTTQTYRDGLQVETLGVTYA